MDWEEAWHKVIPFLTISVTLPTFSRKQPHKNRFKPDVVIEKQKSIENRIECDKPSEK